MKRVLTCQEHYAIRAALWADIKHLPLPRKARLTELERWYLRWLDKFNAAQAAQEEADK